MFCLYLYFVFSFCVGGALKIAHYTGGFGNGSFLGLARFSVVFCMWETGLVHTAMLDVMLAGVGVVWGMLVTLL